MNDNRIGEQIKEWRTKRGFSQAEFGRMMGVNRSLVHAWESGNSMPHINNMLPRICEALSVDFDVVFTEKPTPK